MNDFFPCHAEKLADFRIVGDKAETRRKPHPTIYLSNDSLAQRNKFFGAVYGSDHIPEREKEREILMGVRRKHEILYTPDVLHMAFEATVRNFNDLVEEGIRMMLRATRKGIMRESLDEYALLQVGVDLLHGSSQIASICTPERVFGKPSLFRGLALNSRMEALILL